MILFCLCIWLWVLSFKNRREPPQPDPVYEKELDITNREFDFYRAKVEELRTQRNELSNKIWWFEKKGLPCNYLKKNLEKVEEKLHKVDIKMTKAELTKMKLERKYKK